MRTDRPARVCFIGAGDIRRSRGARTYLLSLVEALRNAGGEMDAFFFQQLVAAPAELNERDEPVTTMTAPGVRYAGVVPSLMWRLYEIAWVLWTALSRALACRTRCGACLVTGPILLPLTPVLRRAYRTLVYIEHGIAEELLVSGSRRGRVKYWATRLVEWAFLRRFDAITTVSAKMGEYFRRRDAVRRYLLVPCCADLKKFRYSVVDRAQLRTALGVRDRFVFVYSGGADLWQRRTEMVEFFREARRSISRAFLLVVSADPLPWQDILRTLDTRDYAVVSVGHADVGRYLSLADAALLMRTRRLVDIVSCPVKFAEYLACGLPIVISPEIGDYTAFVERYAVGVVIDPDDRTTWGPVVEAVRGIVSDPTIRSRCFDLASRLSWDVVGARLAAALGNGGVPTHAVVDATGPVDGAGTPQGECDVPAPPLGRPAPAGGSPLSGIGDVPTPTGDAG